MMRHDIEKMLGVQTGQVANWRACGILDGIGSKGKNGRWQYSNADAILMLEMVGLQAYGFTLRKARKIAEAGLAQDVGQALAIIGVSNDERQ